MNRWTGTLAASFLLVQVAFSAMVQKGRVRLQNSGNKPLAGVQIVFRGANPAISDSNGNFSLEFSGKAPGDTIAYTKVARAGYEWANEKEYRDCVASGTVPLDIVMCPAGKVAENSEKYYRVAETILKTSQKTHLKELDSLKRQDSVSWRRRTDSLGAVFEERLRYAREMADEFAKTNFDDASDLRRQAFELFQRGEIDSAIMILERSRLEETVKRDIQQRTLLERRMQENTREVSLLSKALLFQAQLYVTRFEYDKAGACFDTLLLLTPEDPENLTLVASFWRERGHAERAESLETRILSLPTVSQWWQASANLSLAEMAVDHGQVDRARSHFTACATIAKKLAEENPENSAYAELLSKSRAGLWELEHPLAKGHP